MKFLCGWSPWFRDIDDEKVGVAALQSKKSGAFLSISISTLWLGLLTQINVKDPHLQLGTKNEF